MQESITLILPPLRLIISEKIIKKNSRTHTNLFVLTELGTQLRKSYLIRGLQIEQNFINTTAFNNIIRLTSSINIKFELLFKCDNIDFKTGFVKKHNFSLCSVTNLNAIEYYPLLSLSLYASLNGCLLKQIGERQETNSLILEYSVDHFVVYND